ncbi:WcaI family glycosyltransferase [Ancylobacter terrae]|uniref:WcaI family glycosyltransferase n=1 Tax=Ancylobacter sp. sgz301288 TaxID=3342077 RepID=UPI00385F04B9
MSLERAPRILILGLNYAPEIVGIAVYTTGLAETAKARGWDIHVVAGKPYYPNWRTFAGFEPGLSLRTEENGVELTRVAFYVPAAPSGAKRILHHLSFALMGLPFTLSRARSFRPDLVMTVAPSLIGAPVAWLAARIFGGKTWLHIQDFEVEASMSTGLVSNQGQVARLALGFERWVLGRFDKVSAISPAMCRKCVEKGVPADRVFEFRNWAEIDQIVPLAGRSPYRDEWNLGDRHVALYSGNIANKQGIEIVLAAARGLRERRDIVFVVCGQGPNRARLEELASDLDNIIFRDLQPKERLGDLLGLASVHLMPQLAGAADLVLPSKLTNMLASGRPVVATADPGTGLAEEVEGCGIVTPPGDTAAFTAAITELIDDEPRSRALGIAARARAEERWRKDSIIDGFLARARELIGRT